MNWKRFPLACALAITLGFALARPVAAQDMPAPGPEHLELKRLVGDWTAEIKASGSESKGTATYRLECGGLWLISDFQADFGGMKFQGRGFDGYDPQKKKYVSSWVDSMSTRPLNMEGEMDKATKTLTMIGEGPGPDGKPVKFKSVSRQPDADHLNFKMYMVGPDGKDVEMLAIDYTRKK